MDHIDSKFIGLLSSRLEKFKRGDFDNLDFSVKPRWPLDPNAAFLKGAGVKL